MRNVILRVKYAGDHVILRWNRRILSIPHLDQRQRRENNDILFQQECGMEKNIILTSIDTKMGSRQKLNCDSSSYFVPRRDAVDRCRPVRDDVCMVYGVKQVITLKLPQLR